MRSQSRCSRTSRKKNTAAGANRREKGKNKTSCPGGKISRVSKFLCGAETKARPSAQTPLTAQTNRQSVRGEEKITKKITRTSKRSQTNPPKVQVGLWRNWREKQNQINWGGDLSLLAASPSPKTLTGFFLLQFFVFFSKRKVLEGRCQVTPAATCCSAPPGGGAKRVNSRHTHTHTQSVKFCTVTVYSSRTANCPCGNSLRISALPPPSHPPSLPPSLSSSSPSFQPGILLHRSPSQAASSCSPSLQSKVVHQAAHVGPHGSQPIGSNHFIQRVVDFQSASPPLTPQHFPDKHDVSWLRSRTSTSTGTKWDRQRPSCRL